MKKDILKKIFSLLSFAIIFLIFLIFSMYIIKQILDAQVPNLDELLQSGQDRIFNLKVLGISLQKVMLTIYDDGSFVVDYKNYSSFYLFPIIFASLLTLIISLIVRRIKKHTSTYKI